MRRIFISNKRGHNFIKDKSDEDLMCVLNIKNKNKNNEE